MINTKKQSATERAVEYIKADILSGKYEVGEKYLSENELCRILVASRTTVREALRMVQAMGYLELLAGRGAFVLCTDKNAHNLSLVSAFGGKYAQEEIDEVRYVLEPLAAKLAANRATEEDIFMLLGTASFFERLENATREEMADADEKFHHTVAISSHNELIFDVFKAMKSNATAKNAKKIAVEHKQIIDAIMEKDSKKAEDAMKKHIKNT